MSAIIRQIYQSREQYPVLIRSIRSYRIALALVRLLSDNF